MLKCSSTSYKIIKHNLINGVFIRYQYTQIKIILFQLKEFERFYYASLFFFFYYRPLKYFFFAPFCCIESSLFLFNFFSHLNIFPWRNNFPKDFHVIASRVWPSRKRLRSLPSPPFSHFSLYPPPLPRTLFPNRSGFPVVS